MGFKLADAFISVKYDGSQLRVTANKIKGKANKAGGMLGKIAGQAFSYAFGAAGVLGVGLAFQKIANMGEQFNRKMRSSLAIMGDVSQALRGDMRKAALEAARTTQFSSAETARSFFYLASAGLTAKQSVLAMPQVAKFAQAGMFDLSRATDLATDAQSALGLTVFDAQQNLKNLKHVTDVLVKGNTLANASIEQLSQSMTTKGGAAAKMAGMSIEELTSMLLAMADQGIKAHDAGTAVNIVLRDLKTKAISNADAFKELGIRVYNTTGNLRNIADIIGDIEVAMAGASTKQRAMILSYMGVIDKSKIFLQSLIGTSEKMKRFQKALKDVGGMTDEVANKQLTPFQKMVAELGVTFTRTGKAIMEDLQPAIVAITNGVSHLNQEVNKTKTETVYLKGTFRKLNAEIPNLFVGLEMLADHFGGVSVEVAVARRELVKFIKEVLNAAEGTNAFLERWANIGDNTQEKPDWVARKRKNPYNTPSSPTNLVGRFHDWTVQKLGGIRQQKENVYYPNSPGGYFNRQKFPKSTRDADIKALIEGDIIPFVQQFKINIKAYSDHLVNAIKKMAKEFEKISSDEIVALFKDLETPMQKHLKLQEQLNNYEKKHNDLGFEINEILNKSADNITGFNDFIKGLNTDLYQLQTGATDLEMAFREVQSAGLLTESQRREAERKLTELADQREWNAKVEEDDNKKAQEARRNKDALDQRRDSLIQSTLTDAEKAANKITQIMELFDTQKITATTKRRGLLNLENELTPKPTTVSGRMGFAAFAMNIQDAILKDDTPKKSLIEQQRTNGVLKDIRILLEKDKKMVAGGFPEE